MNAEKIWFHQRVMMGVLKAMSLLQSPVNAEHRLDSWAMPTSRKQTTWIIHILHRYATIAVGAILVMEGHQRESIVLMVHKRNGCAK